MVRIYRAFDVETLGHDIGRKIIGFSKDLPGSPPEFKGKTLVELLTENGRTMYSVRQIRFDESAGILYPESFAVNYGAVHVDIWPLARGFIPEGRRAKKQTLYEIMLNKKEIHVIPSPARILFFEEGKVSPHNFFYLDGTLEEVLGEFRSAGFGMKEFPPGFDSWANPETSEENRKRYLP